MEGCCVGEGVGEAGTWIEQRRGVDVIGRRAVSWEDIS